jgi:hypothetical protein
MTVLLSAGFILTSLAVLILRIIWLLDKKPPAARPEHDEVPVTYSRRAA